MATCHVEAKDWSCVIAPVYGQIAANRSGWGIRRATPRLGQCALHRLGSVGVHEILFADDLVYSNRGITISPPGLWHSEGGNRDSGRGRQSGGIQSFGEHNGWDRHDDTSHVSHTRHNRPDWPTLVEQHAY